MKTIFNSPPMQAYAQPGEGFEKVLHIAHLEWHGIRNATAYSPGQKLLIPGEADLEPDQSRPNATKQTVAQLIEREAITHVIFQGYSDNADLLVMYLRATFGSLLKICVVNHVTTGQFDNAFEMHMLARLFMRKSYGMIDRIASVKPNFGTVFPEIWDKVIINHAPNLPKNLFSKEMPVSSIYTPLDIGWRKNIFTNVMAGILAPNVDQIRTANYPTGLESIANLSKLKLVGYLRGEALLAEMARNNLVLLATFAECQPMTQLEAFAVGTPGLSRSLSVAEFEGDELMDLCATQALDDPALLANDVIRVVDAAKDTSAMAQMIDTHLERRRTIANDRYADFIGL
jgi:hypothetical protein